MIYKKTYGKSGVGGLGPIAGGRKVINGKRVKRWKKVSEAFDFAHDEYIPIYYKGKGRHPKKKPKKKFLAKLFNL